MKKLFLLIFMCMLLLPLSASAQWGAAKSNLDKIGAQTQLESNLETSVGTVISGALALVGTIFLILTVYAGILWMTAQGAEDKVTKAKNIITAAIIGLVITMAAYAITSFVTNRLGGSGTGGGGTSGDCGGLCEAPTTCSTTINQCL